MFNTEHIKQFIFVLYYFEIIKKLITYENNINLILLLL